MRNHRKSLYISIFLLTILLIGIGYAYLYSNLSINGTANVSGNTWDIHFANIQVSPNSVLIGDGKQAATIDPSDNTLITYAVLLDKPGDYYEFTVDIVNAGTVNGMVNSIVSKVNNQAISNLPNYLEYSITYLDGDDIEQNHLLAVNATETIKVRIKYKEDIANNELVGSSTTLSFSIQLNYIQSNSDAINRLATYFLYRNNNSNSHIGNLNTTLGTTYSTEEEMLNNITYPYFLRHTLRQSNNKVTQSDIGFQLDGNIYYLIGGGATYDENSDTWDYSDVLYTNNKSILLSAFGNASCTDNTSYFRCSRSGLIATINNQGNIVISDNDWKCFATYNGASLCTIDQTF